MSDPTQNNTNPPDDEAILRTVEAALAAHRAGTPTPPDLPPPAAFDTARAASAPHAPDEDL